MKKIYFATGTILVLVLTTFSAFAQTQTREETLKEIEVKRAELAASEQRFLSASEEDQKRYAGFLGQRGTGLIRLLPRERYDNSSRRETMKGLSINGGGAYYSFFRLTHEYGHGSDISLEGGWLSTGFAGANYGMLTNLGDIPLEDVSLENASVQFLAAHTPPSEEPKARIEQRKWGTGEIVDGTKYAGRLLLKPNSTYLVRSINYSTSDVLVAFKVVRLDDDDSATILWKLLKKYPTPYLERN